MSEHPPATTALLPFFQWGHLPAHLQVVSRPFQELAEGLLEVLPPGPEVTVALRKLLESKDCAVRAALPPEKPASLASGGIITADRASHRESSTVSTAHTIVATHDGRALYESDGHHPAP